VKGAVSAFIAVVLLATIFCISAQTIQNQSDDKLSLPPESPEVILGDRLFFETRFSQFFFAHFKNDVNAKLLNGDPLMDNMRIKGGTMLPGPFRGQAMNCRQCHLGDDLLDKAPIAGRTYCDFSQRSSIPLREDGLTKTVRNAPIMVNLGLPREVPVLFHYDGEFSSAEDLIFDALTGRNFGWLPQDSAIAIAHIASVIREDNGINPRHVVDFQGKGIPYSAVFASRDSLVPFHLRIPLQYRINVNKASDNQIVMVVAKLINAYMDSLRFGTTNTRRHSESPYDLFLKKNKLPTSADKSESDIAYSRRLLEMINQRTEFEWVTSKDGKFQLHSQDYQFGLTELQGMKIFFATDTSSGTTVGNCVACHPAPQFTDYLFHNNGASQIEYDSLFGEGAFAALEIPSLELRNYQYDAYLPVTSKHPNASNRFRSEPSKAKPGYADLGVWNILGNPDLPKPQPALQKILCKPLGDISEPCTPEKMLPLTIAHFKTPSIRDLGQSEPYFHSGTMSSIEDVLHFYIKASQFARAAKIRNASAELSFIVIDTNATVPLAAFLRSMNEDYH
jgi:cytochrome c peroxidase